MTNARASDWLTYLAEELRNARGTDSQADVAARSGVSDRTIGLLEQKKLKTRPRADTIVRLALATGRNPQDWLKHVGLTLSPEAIDRLRGLVRVATKWDQLKPAHIIEQELLSEIHELFRAKLAKYKAADDLEKQLRDYVHSYVTNALSSVEPAPSIKRELLSYMDMRIHNLQQHIADLTSRVDRLQEHLNVSPTEKRRRRTGRAR
jgi:transcriptional regulator with XRE-family HTH domain